MRHVYDILGVAQSHVCRRRQMGRRPVSPRHIHLGRRVGSVFGDDNGGCNDHEIRRTLVTGKIGVDHCGTHGLVGRRNLITA